MTAKEARVRSKKFNAGQFEEIIDSIKKACDKGETSTWFYENFRTGVREQLEELGYNVGETQFERNETLTKISW